jgi:hypothetical protein
MNYLIKFNSILARYAQQPTKFIQQQIQNESTINAGADEALHAKPLALEFGKFGS